MKKYIEPNSHILDFVAMLCNTGGAQVNPASNTGDPGWAPTRNAASVNW